MADITAVLYSENMNRIDLSFFKKIGYVPKDQKNFITALTHSSYSNETGNDTADNEKFEFLGDSVLGFISAEYLYNTYNDLTEGELTKLRSLIVCQESLVVAALELDIGIHLLLGKGEENSGGRSKPSILSDAIEAVIGAVYLDGGVECARNFILSKIIRPFLVSIKTDDIDDYKSRLQMLVQKQPDIEMDYIVISKTGPAHDMTFKIRVDINGKARGYGTGKSKKEAEQMAAKDALDKRDI